MCYKINKTIPSVSTYLYRILHLTLWRFKEVCLWKRMNLQYLGSQKISEWSYMYNTYCSLISIFILAAKLGVSQLTTSSVTHAILHMFTRFNQIYHITSCMKNWKMHTLPVIWKRVLASPANPHRAFTKTLTEGYCLSMKKKKKIIKTLRS